MRELDANVVFQLSLQEQLAAGPMAELVGHAGELAVSPGSMASVAGPRAGLYARRGPGGTTGGIKLGTSVGTGTVETAFSGDAMTLEIVFQVLADATVALRTIYSYGNASTPTVLLATYPGSGLYFARTNGATQYADYVLPPLTDGAWYYLAVRKLVTSGSTLLNKLCTFEFLAKRLDQPWSATPDATLTGQANNHVTPSGTRYHGVGTRVYSGTRSESGKFDFAFLRVSNIRRSDAELKATFDWANGTSLPVYGQQPTGVVSQMQFNETVDFGSDWSTFPDLSAGLGEISGFRVVAERLLRRFSTPRGLLPFHSTFGYDLRDELNEEMTDQRLFAVKAQVEAQAEEDEAVERALAELTYTAATGELKLQLELETSQGPFALTLKVNQVTVELLEAS